MSPNTIKGRLELVSILRKTIFIQMDGIQINLSLYFTISPL